VSDAPIQAQIDAVECLLLSQQGWLRQAEAQEGQRAEQLAYAIACTRIHMPGLEAALATLRSVQSAEGHADGVSPLNVLRPGQ
jgi:hypothetical protein